MTIDCAFEVGDQVEERAFAGFVDDSVLHLRAGPHPQDRLALLDNFAAASDLRVNTSKSNSIWLRRVSDATYHGILQHG